MRLHALKDVAAETGFSVDLLRQHIADGELFALILGPVVRVPDVIVRRLVGAESGPLDACHLDWPAGPATPRQVAEVLSVSSATVLRRIRDQTLPGYSLGGATRLRWSDVAAALTSGGQQ